MEGGGKTEFSTILGLQKTLALGGGHREAVAEIIVIRGIRGAGHVSPSEIVREILRGVTYK